MNGCIKLFDQNLENIFRKYRTCANTRVRARVHTEESVSDFSTGAITDIGEGEV